MAFDLLVRGVFSQIHNRFRAKSTVRRSVGIVLSLFLFLCYHPFHSKAKVTGLCSNCHTMHASQDGVTSPTNPALTKVDCIGCHSSTDTETIKYIGGNPGDPETSRVPIVNNVPEPSNPLAGGNFYYVKQNQTFGHNVIGIPDVNQDTLLPSAPGRPSTSGGTGCEPCHGKLQGGPGEDCGCKSCHLYVIENKRHHTNDDPDNNKIVEGPPWYRFLEQNHNYPDIGVHGIESSDWEKGINNTGYNDYNQYKGVDAIGSDPAGMNDNSMSDFCAGCHQGFHGINFTGGGTNSSPWFRHPAHIGLPSGGEFANYAIYDPNAPVARKNLTNYTTPASRTTVSASGYTGNDQVMCLSCHRAHASPYPDILRWDYSAIEANNGKTGGCLICHTGKK
ncbi:hypothetical protein JXL19_05360 [bacterium]|nr:hypothetical protein [bacterium]